jgi:2-oxoglutarate dehydrogenase E2 component (dihydrolipoamide succinyltransferase)
VEVRLEEMFEGLVFATVIEWRKQEGDQVASGEPIVEIEADKANHEILAPISGTLASIVAGEGDEIEVGAVLGVIQPA